MRPLKLTMTCFGPFLFETVDFTALGDHLFLISGPTGSGKSTIFDGICYALYGETSASERRPEAMKSDFANPGEACSVTLTFAVGDRTYRIRRQPKQEMFNQTQTRMISRAAECELWQITTADDGGTQETLLASAVKTVNQTVRQILGLTATQFRQIVMLPQGQFSRLLKSGESERIALLKTLFAMDYYKAFERRVEEAHNKANARIQTIDDAIAIEIGHLEAAPESAFAKRLAADRPEGLDTAIITDLMAAAALSNERDHLEKKRLTRELALASAAQTAAARRLATGEALLQRFERREQLLQRIDQLEHQQAKMDAKRQKLTEWRRAALVRPLETASRRAQSAFQEAKDHESRCIAALQSQQSQLDHLQIALATINDPHFDATLEHLREQAARLKASQPALASWQQDQKHIADLRTQIERLNPRAEQVARLQTRQESLQKAIDALQQTASDEQRAALQLADQIPTAAGRVDALKNLRPLYADVTANDAKITAIADEKRQLENALAQAEREHQRLQQKRLAAAAGALAQTLKDGTPCPVCGAAHHPRPAAENEAASRIREAIDACDARLADLKGRLAADDEQHRFLVGHNAEAQGRLLALCTENGLAPDNLTPTSLDAEYQLAVQTHQARQEALAQSRAAIRDTHRQLKRKRETFARVQNELEQATAALARKSELQSELAQRTGALAAVEQQLRALFPQQDDPADLPAVFAQKLNQCESKIRQMTDQREALNARREAIEKQIAASEAALHAAADQTAQAEAAASREHAAFKTALTEHRLTRELYEASRSVDAATTQQVQDQVKEYDEAITSCRANLKALAEELAGRRRPDLEDDRLRKNHADYWVEQMRRAAQTVGTRLDHNRRQEVRIHRQQQARSAALERQKWTNDLYETVKGKVSGCPKISFERYILSAYLQDILISANVFLEDISDSRYHLTLADDPMQKHNRGLSIEVYDDFTGKARTADSLSGGETFMAALSMALGLSDMVQSESGGIRLDTLFIDEGFATLDADALDKAMDCLSRLQRNGRTVGIISHVRELLEVVDDKILVEKTEAGSYIRVLPA